MPFPRSPRRSEEIPNGPFSFIEDPNLPEEVSQPIEKLVRKTGKRRARFENGRFVADDPSTEFVDEAWVSSEPVEGKEQ